MQKFLLQNLSRFKCALQLSCCVTVSHVNPCDGVGTSVQVCSATTQQAGFSLSITVSKTIIVYSASRLPRHCLARFIALGELIPKEHLQKKI